MGNKLESFNKGVKLSVIIPVYNTAPYLPECLQSVQKQTLREIEIICVNDGSTDDSLSILRELCENDSRIKIIDQENHGVSYARNRAIKSAIGEFIAFLDSDDYLPDEKVYEDLYNEAFKNRVMICGGTLIGINSDGTVIEPPKGTMRKMLFEEDGLWDFEDYQFDLGFYRFIFSRQLLIKGNILFPYLVGFEDPVFLAQAMHKGKNFYGLKRVTYCYRKGHHSYELNAKQVEDLLTGIAQNIQLAKENNYKLLLDLQKERLVKTYVRRGMGKRLAEDKEGILRKKFDYINFLLENSSGIEYEAFQYFIDLQTRKIARLEAKLVKDEKKINCLETVKDEYKLLLNQYNCITESTSFKLGRALTFIPRKIRDFITKKNRNC